MAFLCHGFWLLGVGLQPQVTHLLHAPKLIIKAFK
jgi:hypothetical protein